MTRAAHSAAPAPLLALPPSQIAATGVYNPPTEVAKLLLAAAVALEIIGGLALLAGSTLGPLCLMAFLVAVTPIMHNPTGLKGAEEQQEMVALLKNVALFGGLLFMSASLGASKAKAKSH